MRNHFLLAACAASLTLSGCSLWRDEPGTPEPEIEYRTSVLEGVPGVYKMRVQQGNLVTQELLAKVSPGMSKRQVRFTLGTPMLTDAFHPDRWDYVYTLRQGHADMEVQRITLHFKGDSLVRIEGNLNQGVQPAEPASRNKEAVLSVPDYEGSDQGFFSRVLGAGKKVWEDSPGPARSDGKSQDNLPSLGGETQKSEPK